MNPINNLKNLYWHQKNFGFSRLVYSAGMPRSGSTLLFNILRLIFETEYKNRLGFGWVEDVDKISKSNAYLVKTHHLNRIMIWRSYRSFYTYRDIRDVLVSRLRKFKKEPRIEIVRYYISQYEVAKNNDVVMLRYEDFIHNQPEIVQKLSSHLYLDIDPAEIMDQLPDPAGTNAPVRGHDDHTLLHKGHVTGTRRREWEEILTQELQDQIHSEFAWWFKENGYSPQ